LLISPDRSQRCKPLGRSPDLTATLAAVGADVPEPPIGPQATIVNSSAKAASRTRIRPTLLHELRTTCHLKEVRSTLPEHATSTALRSSVTTCRRPRYAPRPAGRHV